MWQNLDIGCKKMVKIKAAKTSVISNQTSINKTLYEDMAYYILWYGCMNVI